MNSSTPRTKSILCWIAVLSLCVFFIGCGKSPEGSEGDDPENSDASVDQNQDLTDATSATDLPFAPTLGAGFENMPTGTPIPIPSDPFEAAVGGGSTTSYLPPPASVPMQPMQPIDYEALGPRNNLDLSLVPSDADMLTIIHPARLCANPYLGTQVAELMGEYLMMDALFQIEPSQIEQIILSSSMSSAPLAPGAGGMMLFRFTTPVDVEQIAMNLLPEVEGFTRIQAELNGQAYWTLSPPADDPMMMPMPGAMQLPCTAVLDERTVVHFATAIDEQILSRRPATSPLAQRAARVNLNRDAIMLISLEKDVNLGAKISEDLRVQFLQQGELFLESYGDLMAIPSVMRAGELSLSLQDGTLVSLMIESTDPANTQQINAVVQKHFGSLQTLVSAMLMGLSSQSGGADPQVAMLNQLAGEAFAGLAITSPTPTRTRIGIQTPASLNAVAPVYLDKAVQRIRDQKEHDLAVMKMQEVWAALVTTQPLPRSATMAANGLPLLSWRVAVLPQMGELELYNQFHHNEPWDSPHNLTLIARIPESYQDSSVELGRTRICVFSGPSTPLSIENLNLNDYRMQSKVALVRVGADRSVPWTAPADVVYEPTTLVQSLGTGDENGEFTVLQFNGWPAALSPALDPAFVSQFILLTQEELAPPPAPAGGTGTPAGDWYGPPAGTGAETTAPTGETYSSPLPPPPSGVYVAPGTTP
jgi:hypothetical protein